jgi:uncharacterized membrane protein YraQ (UPF0718 family)
MADCCAPPSKNEHQHSKKFDWIFWISLIGVGIGFAGYLLNLLPDDQVFHHYSSSIYELMNKMWIGLAIGIFFVGLLSQIPREFIISILGKPYTFTGILRATFAGLLLDMCSHGILLVGMKFYKRGASLGQTMAFLISSPWNSLSLTIILITLIGLKWTILFTALSMIIAIISGYIFDQLVIHNHLPKNPNTIEMPANFPFFQNARMGIQNTKFNFTFFKDILIEGFVDSKMILKWVFFGVVITALVRTFVPDDTFTTFLGPSFKGLLITLAFATVIEVCSEGSVPMASDLIHRAGALGNGFVFLMAGVSTDYTEVMAIRETTSSWKVALFLPLVTVPQIILLGYFLNRFSL